MQGALGRRLGVDLLEEPNELLVPMPRQAVADDGPNEQTQRREQGRPSPIVPSGEPETALTRVAPWAGRWPIAVQCLG